MCASMPLLLVDDLLFGVLKACVLFLLLAPFLLTCASRGFLRAGVGGDSRGATTQAAAKRVAEMARKKKERENEKQKETTAEEIRQPKVKQPEDAEKGAQDGDEAEMRKKKTAKKGRRMLKEEIAIVDIINVDLNKATSLYTSCPFDESVPVVNIHWICYCDLLQKIKELKTDLPGKNLLLFLYTHGEVVKGVQASKPAKNTPCPNSGWSSCPQNPDSELFEQCDGFFPLRLAVDEISALQMKTAMTSLTCRVTKDDTSHEVMENLQKHVAHIWVAQSGHPYIGSVSAIKTTREYILSEFYSNEGFAQAVAAISDSSRPRRPHHLQCDRHKEFK